MNDNPSEPGPIPSAVIIPFPQRQPPAPASEPPGTQPDETPHDRLGRALAQLMAAQAEQRAAVARWRGSIAALAGSVNGLSTSLAAADVLLGRIPARRQD